MSSRLYLFGPFRWELPTGEFLPQLRMKSQALISYVALSANGAVRKNHIASLLWGSAKDPMANFRQAIKEIKTKEDEAGIKIIHMEGTQVSIDFNQVWVDARVATQCSKKYSPALAEQLVQSEPRSLMLDCDIDEEAFSDWLNTERARREEELGRCLGQLLQEVSLKPDNLKMVQNVTSAIFGVDPTNESAHQALIRSFIDNGDKASAKRQYEICRNLLDKELGVTPSQETEQLLSDLSTEVQHQKAHALVLDPGVKKITVDTRPLIVIEEFKNATSDPVLEFLAQSFRSDIGGQLARNDRFAMREDDDISALLKSDGVGPDCYRVRGNLIGSSNMFTILLQLLDAKSGEILWMKRLTPQLSEMIHGMEDFATMPAIEISRMLELRETDKAKDTEESLLTANQCLLRAISVMFKFSEDAVHLAERYILRAIDMDPNLAEAYAWLAFLRSIEIGQGYTRDVAGTREQIGELVRQSLEIRPHSDVALAIAGHLEAFVHHDFGTALEYFEKSQASNPNCAYAWGFSAITHCYIGKANTALNLLAKCRQIMPFDPHPYYFDTARCIASMLAGKYEDAVRIGRQVLRNNPNFHANYRPLISSMGHLGLHDEAAPVMEEFSKVQPDFSVDWHLATYPPLDKNLEEQYVQGLRLAGVSES